MMRKNLVLLLAADFHSTAGLWFGIFANLQLLSLMMASDFAKSLVLVCGPVFLILASPLAGTIIDRSPVKKVITRSGFVQLLAACLLFCAFLKQSVFLMILALILLNLANAFYTPALKSALPAIVPKEQLLSANALYMNVTTLARIGITAISGLALSFFPLWAMYVSVIVCYVVMNILRFFLHMEETTVSKKRERTSFGEIIRLLPQQPVLLVLLCNVSLIYLFLGGSSLTILKFSVLYANHGMQGFLYGVEGVCLLVAGFAVKKLYANRNSLQLNTLLVAGTGCALLLMQAGTVWAWAAYCAYGLYGFLVGCWSPSYSTISQLIVPTEMRGRFFAFQEMWNRIMQQTALLYTGFMFDHVGLSLHLLVTAIMIMVGASVVLILTSRANLKAFSLHQ